MSTPSAEARGLDRRRTATLAAAAVGYALIGAVATWATGEAVARSSSRGLVFSLFIAAVCALGLVWVLLEIRHRRARPGPRLGQTPDGTPALVLGRAPWVFALSVAVTVVLATALLAGGLVATSRGAWVVATLLVVPGGWLVALLLVAAVARLRSGGVFLTPAGVEHRVEGGWWRVGWDDVEGVVPQEPVVLVLAPGARVERGRTARWGWRREVRAPEGTLGIQSRYLAVDGAVLGYLLLAYGDRPDLRDDLGTPASLEWDIFAKTS